MIREGDTMTISGVYLDAPNPDWRWWAFWLPRRIATSDLQEFAVTDVVASEIRMEEPTAQQLMAHSRSDIERYIDEAIARGMVPGPAPILPESGAYHFNYRGVAVREWQHGGWVRFDAFVEMGESDDGR